MSKRRSIWNIIFIVIPLILAIFSTAMFFYESLLPKNVDLKPLVHNFALLVLMLSILSIGWRLMYLIIVYLFRKKLVNVWNILGTLSILAVGSLSSVIIVFWAGFAWHHGGKIVVDGQSYYYEDKSWLDRFVIISEERDVLTIRNTKQWWSEGIYTKDMLIDMVRGTITEGHLSEIAE